MDDRNIHGERCSRFDPRRNRCGAQSVAVTSVSVLPGLSRPVADVPEIILAIFFVKVFGFEPFAGFLALTVATIGFYAKFFAEDIEDMGPTQAEAVKSAGGSWRQWLNYAVQPQVMPRMIGLGLYRFDINFGEPAVVGIVGGGGIGATLLTSFDRYEFDAAAAILLVIIGMVVEYTSGWVRGKVQ